MHYKDIIVGYSGKLTPDPQIPPVARSITI